MAPEINVEGDYDLLSFIYSHELYYIFFVVLNLNINNVNFTGASHYALTLKLNHEHFCRVAVYILTNTNGVGAPLYALISGVWYVPGKCMSSRPAYIRTTMNTGAKI
jgi:hypothetical protein